MKQLSGVGVQSGITLHMITRLFVSLFLSGILASAVWAQRPGATGVVHELEFQSVKRSYRLHVPKQVKDGSTPAPLIFVLHGGGSTAEITSRAKWTPLADEEGFVVVYPDGINKHWNDGRNATKHAEQDAKTDDVGFILATLDDVAKRHPIDRSRIYVTGLSNGGFMSQRLAIEATEHFAAAAIVIATLPTPYDNGERPFTPAAPISILMMNGTKDTFAPYNGGKLTPNFTPYRIDSATHDFGQGTATSTDKAIALWLKHNNLAEIEPVVTTLPDKAPDDGCRVIHSLWSSPETPVDVELYRIEGGGHTIPGGTQYLPKRIIGPVCHDIDGTRVIWEFFKDKTTVTR